jgi:hypothetical protein
MKTVSLEKGPMQKPSYDSLWFSSPIRAHEPSKNKTEKKRNRT